MSLFAAALALVVPRPSGSVDEHEREVLAREANRATAARAVQQARAALEKAQQRAKAAERRVDDALLEGQAAALEKARQTRAAVEKELAAARRELAIEEEGLATIERGLAEAKEARARAQRAAKVDELRAAASAEHFHTAIAPAVKRALAAFDELDAAEAEIEAAYAASCAASVELRELREPVPEALELSWSHLALPFLEAFGFSPQWVRGSDFARIDLLRIFAAPRGRGVLLRALNFIVERRQDQNGVGGTAEEIAALQLERDPVIVLQQRELAERHQGWPAQVAPTPPAPSPTRIFNHSEDTGGFSRLGDLED